MIPLLDDVSKLVEVVIVADVDDEETVCCRFGWKLRFGQNAERFRL